jgi:hypothetical protein
LAICAVFARWLIRSALEDTFTLVVVGGLLWLVFGGYQGSEQQEPVFQPSSSLKQEAIRDSSVHLEITPVEKVEVPRCLVSCRDKSTTGNRTLSALESGHNSLHAADASVSVPKAKTIAELAEETILNKDQLTALQYWHDYPEFNDTNQNRPGGRLQMQYVANHYDPVFLRGDGQVYEDVDSWLGRPLEADEKDLVFLLEALYTRLPQYMKNAIDAESMQKMIKTRSQNGENFWIQELELQWWLIRPGTVVAPKALIRTRKDIQKIVGTTRKKSTPACPFEDRRYIG